MSDYMGRLKQTGYIESFRTGILKQALARYEGMVKADQEGGQPLYRAKIPKTRKQLEKRNNGQQGMMGSFLCKLLQS